MNKRTVYRNILILNQIKEIIKRARDLDVRVCLLKGAALINQGVCKIYQREMEDVDVLIKTRDLNKFLNLLNKMGYKRVCSGEPGFYRNGEKFIVDVHTSILYADKKDLNKIWLDMKDIGEAKIMDKENHFLYILCHGLIHHAGSTGKWIGDAEKLIKTGIDWQRIFKLARNYGLTELVLIAKNHLDIPIKFKTYNKAKKKYMDIILSTPHYEDKGHYLRPVAVKSIKEKIRFGFNFIFPDLKFLNRRYKTRPPALMLYIRPFILFLKVLQSAFFLNPFKNFIKA